MKRHPSLIPLSRDHHGALILARLLQEDAPPYKELPLDPKGKAEYALKFYREELLEHFAEEEKIIPVVQGISAELDQLMKEMAEEHHELHRLFGLIDKHPDLVRYLDQLGKAMEVHIRKEDRQIFPMIQDNCSEAVLAEIAETLKID